MSELRSILQEKRIKPADFARMLGVSTQTINNWFRRGVPHVRAFEVAGKLGCSVEDIAQTEMKRQAKFLKTLDSSAPATVEDLFDLVEPHLDNFTDCQLAEFKGWIEAKRRLRLKVQ